MSDSKRRIASLEDAGNSLSQKIASQQEEINRLQSQNSILQQKKPFLRKKTILLFLNIITYVVVLSFLTICIHGDIDKIYNELIFTTVGISALFVLVFILLIKTKYIFSGLICLFESIALGMLITSKWIRVANDLILLAGVIVFVYFFLGIITFFKEKN